MQRFVGIPGCGIPTKDHSKNLKLPYHQDSVNNQFLYNLNHQDIPHDTTNIYSSFPKQESSFTTTELSDDINIPGAFMQNINEELAISQSDQNENYKDVFIGGLSDTEREQTPRSTPTPFKTLKTSSVVQQALFYPSSNKTSAGFTSFNDVYNSTILFDFGSRNYNLSTSSCKEISSSFNQTFISVQKKLTKNRSECPAKSQTKTFNVVSKGSSGKWTTLVYPWERSIGNKLISTASAREISYQTTKPTTSISQPFIHTSKYSSDIFYDAASVPPNFVPFKKVSPNIVSSNTGAQISFSTPWEMGFNNKIMSTSSLKEISYQTKISVNDIPFNFNRSKNPTGKNLQTPNVRTNIISSGTGAGVSLCAPWEMGFNNRKLSTSSVREISTKCNKTVSEIPISLVNKSSILPFSDHGVNTNFDTFSSNAGAFFSLCHPWEMGFNNRSISTSTAREISNRSKLIVIDIPQGFQTNYHVKKSASYHTDLPIQKATILSVGTNAMSMGFGSGMSLATPNHMGFNNILMSSSSIQEISTKSNNIVLECSNGVNTTRMKQETRIDRFTNNDFKDRNIIAPVIVGANLGPRNPFVSPQDMECDNKPLSIFSLREISSNTNKTVYSPHNISTLGSTIDNPNKEGQKLNQNVLSIDIKNIVGSNIAAQGPAQSKFYPPLGTKGLIKSFSEIYSPPNIITKKENISNECQEPLEGAFTPNAISAREFRGNILLHSKSNNEMGSTKYTTSGKYHLLFDDLHNSRITTNIFGSTLKPLETDTNKLLSKKNDFVPLLDTYIDQNGTANRYASENQGLQGRLITLSSLPTVDKSVNKTPSNKKVYQLNSEIKPKKNELITLDSILEKTENTGRNASSAFSTQLTTFKIKSSEHNNRSAGERDYWKFVSESGRTRILQGSRRSATDDQITGRSNIYVDFNNPTVRRRSLGSITNSKEMEYYPSLIDSGIPTYGFYENTDRLDLLASNEYYVSNPITEVHKKRLSFSRGPSPTDLSVTGGTIRNEESWLEIASDEAPNITSSSASNPLKETVPRSFINASVSRQRPAIRKQSPRRKSNALNIFEKFTQAVTKSTI